MSQFMQYDNAPQQAAPVGGPAGTRELCRAFRNNGRCRYGDSCQFEHSEGAPILPPVCFAFRDNGSCDHGDACRFLHGENDQRDFSRSNKSSGTKACSSCGQELGASEFSQNQWRKPASKARSCKTCLEQRVPQQRAGGAGGAGKSCWNCGGVGHLSRDCPEPINEDAKKPKQRRSNGRGQKCFNCGEFGHISAECPNKAMGPKCYNCGNFGHISSECEQPSNQVVQQDDGGY